MRQTKIMHFDWYAGKGTRDFEAELRKKLKLES